MAFPVASSDYPWGKIGTLVRGRGKPLIYPLDKKDSIRIYVMIYLKAVILYEYGVIKSESLYG